MGACRRVEGEQVGGDGVEVDLEVVALAAGVELDGVAEFSPGPGGEVRGVAVGVEHRDHKIDGQAVLMSPMWAKRAAAGAPGGLAKSESCGGALIGQGCVGVEHHVANLAGDAGDRKSVV